MAKSNRDKTGEALEVLRDGLYPSIAMAGIGGPMSKDGHWTIIGDHGITAWRDQRRRRPCVPRTR